LSLRLPHDEYQALLQRVLNRDGWRCRYPHCQLRNNLHCHHVQFRSEGGPDESWNLLTLCSFCHDEVHAYRLFISVPEDNWIGPGGGCDGKVIFSWDS
jgi:5-methylcytosine-specific restriction endonuclease McrA